MSGQRIIDSMHYYEVAPTRIVRQDQMTFTYASPDPLQIGALVTVPIGKTSSIGVVVERVKKPNYDTKHIASLIHPKPLPLPLLKTALWMSEYYRSHLATTFQTILPAGLTKVRQATKNTPSLPERNRTNFLLNKHQVNAIEQIESMSAGTAILRGITGSGKTAVYIELAKRMLASGKSVIVLVPEIALTSQLVSEFTHHFTDIILTHSRQTEAERHRTWRKALTATKPQVIIGPRSALFLPLDSLGLVVIDEAHEPSYKQDQSPKYSALRVASILARHHDGKVIQGSATPLISELYLAEHAGRPVIPLDTRANDKAVEPEITLVDMTKKGNFSTHRFISNTLRQEITHALERNEQTLIYHNRRGSASTTLCEQCGWSAICPRCFVPYTLHADRHILRCHICGDTQKVSTSCPDCGSTDIIHKGIGTKLIEAELQRLYPGKSIARFDGDVESTATLEKRYQELYDGNIDIIIGTQVVAKGLDLPHLRLVGVIQADAGLSLPDYLSSERTFQLLAQVIGRVGRNEHPTKVIVQSYQPTHPAIQLGIAQNYQEFYTTTLAERHRALFPPFAHLLKLTCVYKTEAATIKNIQALVKTLRQTTPPVTIFGPTPAFYERQHDTYRWQIVLKSSSRQALLDLIPRVPTNGHWHIDLDPMSLL